MTRLMDAEEYEADDNDISLTSLNLTITLAFFGMIWSITSYILFTKWKCINDQTIWESQLLPLLKPIWETHFYPFLHTICCALCIQAKQTKPMTAGTSSQYNATTENGADCGNVGHQLQHTNGYQTLHSVNDQRRPDDTSQSSNQASMQSSTADSELGLPNAEGEHQKKPLLGSREVILMFSITQILVRPFIIAANIVYIVLNYKKDHSTEFDEPEGYGIGAITDQMIIQETMSLITGPITNAIYWSCCWKQCRTQNRCRRFLELMRFYDLQIAVFLAPFTNTHLYALGGWWYIVLGVRLVFYTITFSAAVVAGMRFVCACYSKIFFKCACDNDVLEIRDLKQLILEIGFQLIPIFVKINTSSSALATFLKLGTKGGPSFRAAYCLFSLIRSITALFSLGFSGAMLRWALIKKEHKWEDSSWLTKVLRFLDKYQPHIHCSFFFDMLTYFSLLVLNLILLELVSEKDYYCYNNCADSGLQI